MKIRHAQEKDMEQINDLLSITLAGPICSRKTPKNIQMRSFWN